MKKKKEIKVSDVCENALENLDKVEIVYSVDEIILKKVEGRMLLHLKSGHIGNA